MCRMMANKALSSLAERVASVASVDTDRSTKYDQIVAYPSHSLSSASVPSEFPKQMKKRDKVLVICLAGAAVCCQRLQKHL